MDYQKKRFRSLNETLRERFGEKIYKIALNGGMSCPNRDGTIGTGGCIFCSRGGSGEFASDRTLSITDQIEQGKRSVGKKIKNGRYIAYFQAFTNTYAPVDYLEKIFTEAICHPDVAVLSVATRPDCLPDEVLSLLERQNRIKPVWVELGLQTIHQPTADFIHRGYSLFCFESAFFALKKAGIEVVVHTILGLPGETDTMIFETMDYLSQIGIDGIKLQLLHVLKDTKLEEIYRAGEYMPLTMAEYVDLVIGCIERLDPSIVIHRITGDSPHGLLVAPAWSEQKWTILNTINDTLEKRGSFQGKNFHSNFIT